MLLTLYHTIPTLTTLTNRPYENIMGKGENAGNQHFLLFPLHFLPFPKQISIFQSPAGALNLAQSKNLSFGKELIRPKLNQSTKSTAGGRS